ncbi:hypothetical protein FB478_103153 [Arthrobacter sp. AG367]|uniref:hypothetical protein n=1 Tax=unclassified Arthrobacter TaxID=235627 RepID=UPI00036E03F4|nr:MULTISPECIES: hypothetical protein [unclassified Arthrobacter]TWD53738.1 hypothetical protein FB478_103153 [Arthrobacter sp. AG367]BCW53989.1 hypothetical protein StoSoilB19_13630 [Arthrobacter sp. StoSoilB19]
MSTRSRGKRLATGITAAVGVGSFAAAGVAAAAVYAATPSVIARTTHTQDSSTQDKSTQDKSTQDKSTQGSTPKSGSSRSDGDDYGTRKDNSTRRSKSYGNNGSTSPVQPGNGGTVHGRSSGS